MTIDANQNVGIGTTDPTALLHLEAGSDNATGGIRLTNDDTGVGSTDGTALFVEQNTTDFFIRNYENAGIRLRTNDTDALYVSSGQKVGIGTTSPDSLLHLFSTSATPKLTFESQHAGTQGPQIDLFVSSSSPAVLDELGDINFVGMDSTNVKTFYSMIRGLINDPTNGSETGALQFMTRVGGSSAVRMAISGSNIGIGVTDPDALLEVGPDANSRGIIKLTSTAAAKGAFIQFFGNDAESAVIGYEGGSEVVSSGVQGDFVIRNVLSGKDIILTTNSGNVGINTVAPTSELHLVGDIKVQDSSDTSDYLFFQHNGTDGRLVSNRGKLKLEAQSSAYMVELVSSGISGSSASTGSFGKINAADHMTVGRHMGPAFGADAAVFPLHVIGTDTDDTAAILVQNSNTGDANILFNISGQSFTMGIDNSESGDPFVISDSSDLSTTARMTIASSGVISGDFNDTSDITLKENIFEISSSYEKVKQLNPVTFNWKEEEEKGTDEQIGFIAQEVEKVYPQLVRGEEGNKSVNVVGLVSVLTKTVQELTQKVEELEKKLQ